MRFLGIDSRFLATENRLMALDSKFEVWGARFEAQDAKFAALESKFDAKFDAQGSHVDWDLKELCATSDSKFDGVMRQFEAFQKRMDSQFKWLVGIQFGVLVSVIGVLLSP